MSFFQTRRQFALYLLFLSLFGMVLTYMVTFRFGPGLSTDGARYLATAQNLLAGKGFYDYLNQPLTQFPPLYSILIAAISFITRLDVFVAAQYLNILSFGLVIWLAGYFFYGIFPNEPLFQYFGSAVFATSLSLLIMASNILSDLLFLAFTLAFLIAATNMLKTGTARNIVLLGMIAAVSTFQRYAGLALILTGSVLLLFLYRKKLVKGFVIAGSFGILSALPILLWVYFHNYLPTGILFGVRLPPVYLGNLQVTIEKAVHWFLPVTVTRIVPVWAILLMGLLTLVVGNRPADWKRWLHFLFTPHFLPSLTFSIFYLGILIFNVSYYEVRWPFMDRIHIILLPALLALIFLTIRELTPSYLRRRSHRTLQIASIAVFLLWLAFPVYNLQKYLTKAYYQGETSEYNMYNIPILRESGIREYFASQPIGTDQKIYSNYEAAAWFLTRSSITKLPFGDVKEKRVRPTEVLKRFPDWPGKDGNGYVIWIDELSFKPYVLSPEQLTERANFQLVYWSKGGEIYRLTPK
ncbi:MAG: ArnT family glycosyltransferase [Syntrophothermus sp.]